MCSVGFATQTLAKVYSDYRQPNQEAEYYLDFFLNGRPTLYLRGRIEHASDNNPVTWYNLPSHHDGDAFTLSTRLAFTSAHICHFWGHLSFNNVASYWRHNHNSGMLTTPTKVQYAEIPDPKGTSLEEALLAFQGFYHSKFLFGRQIIKLDNERFVSNISFRQTSQTFDAFSIENNYITGLQLYYAYINNVNTIWHNHDEALYGERKHHTHLLNASYEIYPFGALTGYLYYIKDRAERMQSNRTFGVRYEGNMDLQRANLLFKAEYAFQKNNSSNPVDYHAEYYFLDGSFSHPFFQLGIAYEWLEGNDLTPNKCFITPLGDFHKFNGYADRFRTTPNQGLTDLMFYAKIFAYGIQGELAHHRFHAQADNIKFGDEWDIAIVYPFLKFYKLNAGFATFSGNVAHRTGSTNRFWVSLEADIG